MHSGIALPLLLCCNQFPHFISKHFLHQALVGRPHSKTSGCSATAIVLSGKDNIVAAASMWWDADLKVTFSTVHSDHFSNEYYF